MKKLLQTKRSARGFTLIEVIVTIVVAAILGTMFITFMGTAVTRSSDQVNQAKNLATAKAAMEKNSSYYATYLATLPAADWAAFITNCGTNATCTPINGCPVCISDGGTIEATITVGDQKLVTYYWQ